MTGRAFLFLLLAGSIPCHGGAWTQPQGGHYLKAAFSFLQTSEEFDHQGQRRAIQEEQFVSSDAAFRDISLRLYGEMGLREHLTLVAQVPVRFLQSERRLLIGGGQVQPWERLRNAGLGDLTIRLRRALVTGTTTLSAQGGLAVPLGYSGVTEDGPPLGTGELAGELQLLIGQSLHPLPLYLGGAIGYRARRGPLDDEFLYEAEAGGTWRRLSMKLGLSGVQNRSTPPDIAGSTVATPLPGGGGVVPQLIVGDQHWTQVNPSVVVAVSPGLGWQVDWTRTVAGTNTLSGNTLSTALIFTGE